MNMLPKLFSHFWLGKTHRDRLIGRVHRYRGIGSSSAGLQMLSAPQIDDLDYALQGADISCARVNFPKEREPTTGDWFAIKKGSKLSKKSLGNSHGSTDIWGRDCNEDGFLSIPKRQFQVSAQEVVWHHLRVKELREQGISQPSRILVMIEERKSRPWLKA